MKSVINIIMLLSVCLLLALCALYIFQHKFIYPAPKPSVTLSLSEQVSKIDLGLSHGFLIMPKLTQQKRIPLMIFTHGNAELASDWLNEFELLTDNNIAVFVVEFPGYGGSTAKPNIDNINDTILKAYDFVVTIPEIDDKGIFAYGRSIGGGAAALLAKQRPLVALALESTFSSFPKLISEKGLPSFLITDRYENEEVIKELDIPLFLYHGKYDNLIPFSHAKSLLNAGKNVTFYSENCGHNDCPRKWKELLAFLTLNNLG